MLLILKSDIKQGCKSNLIKYAAVLFFAIVSTFYFNRVLGIKCRDGLAEQVGILDVLVYLVGGVNPMNEGDKNFEIPIMWMSMRLLVCSCIFIYPIKDLYGRGMTVLLKYGSKTKWWLSKCIWTVMQVFIVYSIFYAGVIATSYGLGIDKWTYSATIGARMSGARIVDQTNLILLVFALPVIYALIMALIEINLSLFMEPIFSLFAVVVYDVLSTCVMTPLLLGNISMVLRIKGVASRGIDLNTPLVAGIVLAVLSVVLGLKYIKKKDILGVD
ncbi:MAG: hypothetical protein E7252_08280 [Lachnospira sp.]|nr:hypothetical protein [Lachnospira sp.]